jgi:hypothetical protein
MQTKWISHFLVIVSLLLAALPAQASVEAPAASAPTAADMLQFNSGGHALGFSTGGMYAATGSHALHVEFTGANLVGPQVDPSASTDGNPDTIPALGQVTYPDLWDGVSLAYNSKSSSIYTTTYTLAPGADPAQIRLRYNAPVSLNEDGTLGILFETGSLTESAPLAWQEINGEHISVPAAFRLEGQEVSFALGVYDPDTALTIDPSLYWHTFLGDTHGADYGYSITVDGSGNVYVTGESQTNWEYPVRAHSAGMDGFAAKLTSTGALDWNTFLGGSGFDRGQDIAVDGSGNVFVIGESDATWGSPLLAFTFNSDTFVAKLNLNGVLTWNTFLGGTGEDSGAGIAVNSSGHALVTGHSSATWGFPTRAYTGGYDAYYAQVSASGVLSGLNFLGGSGDDFGNDIALDETSGFFYVIGESSAAWGCAVAICTVRAYTANYDTFIAKVSTSTGDMSWNTFLGGAGDDMGDSVSVDGGGNLYAAGYSSAAWEAPVRAYTSGNDVYAAKLNASTGVLTWNTFLGSSGFDTGAGINADGSGNVYVAGCSTATWESPLRAHTGGFDDAFAAKLTSAGALTWNTFLGGSGGDCSYGLDVSTAGTLYVTGGSDATWGSPVRAYTGSTDAIAVKINTSGALTWNTFLGAGGSDIGYSIALDGSGNIYVAGSSDATWGSPARAYTAGYDAFVAKLVASTGVLTWSTFLGGNGTDQGFDVTVDGSGNIFVTGDSSATWGGGPVAAHAGGAYDGFAARLDPATGVLTWYTFLGGAGDDRSFDITADGAGNLYATGSSTITWGTAPTRGFSGVKDAFVVKLNATTGVRGWNTFLGGIDEDSGDGITVDTSGNLYVTGVSYDAWGCAAYVCTARNYTALWDAFLAKLNASNGALILNTFLGGTQYENGSDVTLDGSGNVYVVGGSSGTWGAPIDDYDGNSDAMVAKLDASDLLLTWNTFLGGSGYDDGFGIDTDNSGNIYIAGWTYGVWGSAVRPYSAGMDSPVIKLNSSGQVILLTFLGGSGHDRGYGIVQDGGKTAYVVGYSEATWGSPVRAYSGGDDAFVAKLDIAPPTVLSSLRADANPTNAASVHFTVTFSETVTGVDTADFKLYTTGTLAGAAVSDVSGSGSTRTVTVSTGTGYGTLRLDVVDNDTILDARANPLGGKGTGGIANGYYNSGEFYTIPELCYSLSRTHTGSGSNPTASPINSTGCTTGQYHAGEAITLTASPALGWKVGSWSGTNNNSSTSTTNSVTMPASNRTVKVNYILKLFLPLILK